MDMHVKCIYSHIMHKYTIIIRKNLPVVKFPTMNIHRFSSFVDFGNYFPFLCAPFVYFAMEKLAKTSLFHPQFMVIIALALGLFRWYDTAGLRFP